MVVASSLKLRTNKLLLGAATIAVISGALAAIRLGPERSQNLLLTGLIALMAGSIAFAPALPSLPSRVLLSIGSAFALGDSLIAASPTWVASIAIVTLIFALLCLPPRVIRRDTGDLLIAASAIAVIGFLGATSLFDLTSVPASIALVSGAASALALAVALFHLQSRDVADLPFACCLAAAAATLLAMALTADRVWLTSTLLLVAGAFVVHSTVSKPNLPDLRLSKPQELDSLVFAVLACASSVAALAVSYQRGWSGFWPLLGAMAIGIIGLASNAITSHLALQDQQNQLMRAATESRHDVLTRLLNRRGVGERLQDEIARSLRYGHALSILMLDLDDFKQVNDRFGHTAGDDVLRAVARSIGDSLRSIDLPARLGGEEFLVVLPETGIQGALVVAERIRESVATHANVTVSIGAVELDPQFPDEPSLIQAADRALYSAKRAGKNRVVSAL